MNRNEAESLAGDYALGALSGPELAEFEANLARNPELQRLVAAWERRLTPLAATLPEVEPRASVWDAIETALDEAGPPATVTVREREGEWRMLAPGLEIKLLLVDREADFQSFPAAAGARAACFRRTITTLWRNACCWKATC
jgi:anti-sigma factor RsiW